MKQKLECISNHSVWLFGSSITIPIRSGILKMPTISDPIIKSENSFSNARGTVNAASQMNHRHANKCLCLAMSRRFA